MIPERAISQEEGRLDFTVSNHFYDLFTYQGEINFERSIPIWISTMDVSPDNRFAITDRRNNRVSVFNDQGSHLYSVLPDTTDQMVEWGPVHAGFDVFGNLIVSNSEPWAAMFNANGHLIQQLQNNNGPFAAVRSTAGPDGYIYSYQIGLNGNRIARYSPLGRFINAFGNPAAQHQTFTGYVNTGRSFAMKRDGSILYSNMTLPIIYHYTPDGELLAEIEFRPEIFDKLVWTLNTNDISRVRTEISRSLTRFTFNNDLYILDNNLIMLQYRHHWDKYYIQLFNLDSRSPVGDAIELESPVLTASNGRVYFLTRPDDEDASTNIGVTVFEINRASVSR